MLIGYCYRTSYQCLSKYLLFKCSLFAVHTRWALIRIVQGFRFTHKIYAFRIHALACTVYSYTYSFPRKSIYSNQNCHLNPNWLFLKLPRKKYHSENSHAWYSRVIVFRMIFLTESFQNDIRNIILKTLMQEISFWKLSLRNIILKSNTREILSWRHVKALCLDYGHYCLLNEAWIRGNDKKYKQLYHNDVIIYNSAINI